MAVTLSDFLGGLRCFVGLRWDNSVRNECQPKVFMRFASSVHSSSYAMINMILLPLKNTSETRNRSKVAEGKAHMRHFVEADFIMGDSARYEIQL